MDYNNVIVNKPWGKEYLCYRNKEIAIWYLHIEADKETSMHCHPNKNTGFVVLEGHAKLSFLRNSIELKGLDKIHIFRSRFHSTKAITDSFILEIETPEDKHDLVRLDDAYGRAGTEYEGKSHHVEKNEYCFWIPEATTVSEDLMMNGCIIRHLKIKYKHQISRKTEDDIYVITNGGIVTDKEQKVVWPGDVIDGKTLDRLVNAFEIQHGTTMIHITRVENDPIV